ncbi:MAG: TIGR03067 domain-containing protein [Isosphaeraceae bacterium]
MMRRPTRWAALSVFALFATVISVAAVRADDKVSGDLKKMQGTWVSDNDGHDSKWAFDGENLKTTVGGQEYTSTVKVDEKAEPHRAIDVTIKDGPAEAVGKVAKAIYKFDGERLILCVALPSVDTRPTDFKSVEGENFVFELKKE